MYSQPLAYFITFRTYGTWLHGDERGSVDRIHNQFGTPLVPPSGARKRFERDELAHAPVRLTDAQRDTVSIAIRAVANHNQWFTHALAVRSNHVHIVITAGPPPERVMNSLKAWSTRLLRQASLATPTQRVWSRHGSTIYLFRTEKVHEKIDYVATQQESRSPP